MSVFDVIDNCEQYGALLETLGDQQVAINGDIVLVDDLSVEASTERLHSELHVRGVAEKVFSEIESQSLTPIELERYQCYLSRLNTEDELAEPWTFIFDPHPDQFIHRRIKNSGVTIGDPKELPSVIARYFLSPDSVDQICLQLIRDDSNHYHIHFIYEEADPPVEEAELSNVNLAHYHACLPYLTPGQCRALFFARNGMVYSGDFRFLPEYFRAFGDYYNQAKAKSSQNMERC